VLLWLYSRKPRPLGQVSGAFLVGYGVLRFTAEFFREPDGFLGLLACVIKRLSGYTAPWPAEMPFFVAAAGGALMVGAVSSVMDTPRLAFMLLWCLLLLWQAASFGRAAHLRDRLRAPAFTPSSIALGRHSP